MKKIFFISLLLFFSLANSAAPAWPDSILVHQPDGSDLWVYDRGDEFYGWVETTDGFVIVKNVSGVFEYATSNTSHLLPSGVKVHNRSSKSQSEINHAKSQIDVVRKVMSIRKAKDEPLRTPHIPSIPVIGTRKVLTIIAEFSDLSCTYTRYNFDSLMNTIGYSGHGNAGSVRDFYYENSYEQLTLQSTVIGPFLASLPSYNYIFAPGGSAENAKNLVIEAINWADAQGVDFSTFDGDNDGYVDCIHVIYAGNYYSTGGSGIIWPFNSKFITPIIKDGVNISEFIMTPEKLGAVDTEITSIGVICHELGHVLGSPDFYGLNANTTDAQYIGTGVWDIMGNGANNLSGKSPAHHNPFTKTVIFQWTTPNTISSSEENSVFNIPASSQNAAAIYKIPTLTTGEYYLLENRQKVSFDSSLPYNGLLVYHINDDIEDSIPTNCINTTLPQKCYLVNPMSIQNVPTNLSSYGQTYMNVFSYESPTYLQDNIFFTSQTTPSSQSWAGVSTGVDVCFIQHNGSNMKFVVNPQIEGPYTMTDTTAWYHIRNVPAGATITWSIQNISPQTFQFETASPQNRDSMRIAWRQIPPDPGLPINGNSEVNGPKPRYQQADITVTVSSGGQSYSTTKRIRKEQYSLPFMLRDENSNDHIPEIIVQGDYVQITKINGSSTIEVWNALLGRVLTQRVTDETEMIDVRNLPQGVYIVILKEGETIVAETKVFIQ